MNEKTIMTVRGPITTEKLGFTSMHEHVMFFGEVMGKRIRPTLPPNQLPVGAEDPVTLQNVGVLLNNSIMAYPALMQDREDEMLLECKAFQKSGGQSILELSVPGIRYDNEMIRRISQESGLNIIVSTGFYTWDSWPEQYRDWSTKQFREHMLYEVAHGVEGSDIYPGCVKIGLQELNAMEERALRAAAQVCVETGLPLTIHPCNKAGANRMEVIKLLRQEGFDMTRLVFAHTRVETYPASLRELLYHPELYWVDTTLARRVMETGATCSFEFMNPLGFEVVGDYDNGDIGRMAGFYELIRDGYSDRMVLGNDSCGRTMLSRHGAMGYLRMTTFVIPTLKNVMGVSEADIRRMTVDNPARVLAC